MRPASGSHDYFSLERPSDAIAHMPRTQGTVISTGGCFWWAAWRTSALGGEGQDSEEGDEGCEVQHRAASMPTPHPLPLHPLCCCARPPVSQEINRLGQGRGDARPLVLAPTPPLLPSCPPALLHSHTHPPGHTPVPAYKRLSLIRLHPASPLGQRIGQVDPLPPSVDIKSPPRAPLSLSPPSVLLLFVIITEKPQHPSQPGQQPPAANPAHASRPP